MQVHIRLLDAKITRHCQNKIFFIDPNAGQFPGSGRKTPLAALRLLLG